MKEGWKDLFKEAFEGSSEDQRQEAKLQAAVNWHHMTEDVPELFVKLNTIAKQVTYNRAILRALSEDEARLVMKLLASAYHELANRGGELCDMGADKAAAYVLKLQQLNPSTPFKIHYHT